MRLPGAVARLPYGSEIIFKQNNQAEELESMNQLAREQKTESSSEITPAVRSKVIDYIYSRSGIALGSLTCNFVDTRLRRRLRALQVANGDDYIDYLARQSDEVEHLVNAFTTNETSFFRTTSLWRYIEDTLLPELAENNTGRSPAFWSAACSTGEEPYSLAMLSCNRFPTSKGRPRIFATDISTEVLEKASQGIYSGRTINRLKKSRSGMLKNYFTQQENEYQVVDSLRKIVRFEKHNLMQAPAAQEQYDLVLLRNVLIYFSQPDQIRILRHITSSIRPGGMLAIGESESLAFFDSGLEFVKPFLYRKPKRG